MLFFVAISLIGAIFAVSIIGKLKIILLSVLMILLGMVL